MYVTTFTVSGRGSFPLDMLRYDHCWPHTGHDVDMLTEAGPRRVVLATAHSNKHEHRITPDRWNSFGWTCAVGITAKV